MSRRNFPCSNIQLSCRLRRAYFLSHNQYAELSTRSDYFCGFFYTYFFRPPKTKKRKSRRLFLHKINQQHSVMYYLVNSISNLFVPRLRRIYHDMDTKQHEELPDKPEHNVKRQTIQQAVHYQMIPIISFLFGLIYF